VPSASRFTAPRVAVEGVGAGGQIGAGAEAAAGAGHDDGADVVVLVGGIERVDQFLLHGAVESIELVGPVQGDGENLLGDLVLDRLVRHGCFLSLNCFCRLAQPHRHARPCAGHPRLSLAE
jgi:hypothetical protein